MRNWHIGIPALIGALSIPLALFMKSPSASIAVITITACAIFSALPNFWALPARFLSGAAAAAGIALINTVGNLAGFAAPYVTGAMKDATGSYHAPMFVVGAFMLMSAVLAFVFCAERRPGMADESPAIALDPHASSTLVDRHRTDTEPFEGARTMKEKIALFGAGGKMGFRLTSNLLKSDYRVSHVEVSEAGRQRLKDELNVDCVSIDAALDGAQVVILAVPDTLIGKLSHEIAPKLPAGTMVMTLDAAAPFAGHLPNRHGSDVFRRAPVPPADLQRRPRSESAARFLRRRVCEAVDHERADARTGVRVRPR